MAHIQTQKTPAGVRYQVRWTEPSGKVRTKRFARLSDAKRHEAQMVADIERGTYIAPSSYTFADAAADWLKTKRHKTPATLAGYRTLLRTHVLPMLGGYQLRRLDPSAVERFIADLEAKRSPATVRNAYFLVKSVLDLAVHRRKLDANPVKVIELPPQSHREELYLSAAEIEALAAATLPPYRELILFAAYTGLRAGEIVALRVRNLDLLHRQVHVRESVTFVEGVGHVRGPTKTKQTRTVPLPRFLAELMTNYIVGKSPDDSVFTARDGSLLKHNSFARGDFKPAVKRAGLPSSLRFHDLRHTTASLLIASGAHPKEVSSYLGHSTIRITMDRYGHLYPNALAALADRLDAARFAAPTTPAIRELRS